jgi:hypothetical protein
MKTAYTLFEITNAKDLRFRYRFIKVRETLPDDARQPIRLQRWADELWRRRLRCPVFPLRRGSDAFFIVPADVNLTGIDLSYVDVPHIKYNADPTEEIKDIVPASADVRELELLARMLERPFSDKLFAAKQQFWQDTWTRFFRLEPENVRQPNESISAFRGVAFSIVPIPSKGIYLAVDVVTRYVGRASLFDYRHQGRAHELVDHLEASFERRKWLLRDNGSTKYRCIYAGDTGKSISELRIEDLGQTVLEYYQEKFPSIAQRLDPNEPAIFCARDKKDGDAVPAPASLLFPVFPFERGFRSRCSVSPQLGPADRQTYLRNFLRDLGPVVYASQQLQITDKLLAGNEAYFPLPALEFGQGYTLAVNDLPKAQMPYSVNEWGAEKLRALMQVGPYFREDFPPIVLLYPTTIQRRAREEFIRAIEQELTICTATPSVKITKQAAYTPDPDGHDLLVKTSELKREYDDHALFICVLSLGFEDYVHNRFKAECDDLFSQCVKEENLVEVTIRRAKRRNFALGAMMALGFKPWVLSAPLHADVYIGIDVLAEQVAYTFLYGQGGREIFRDRGHSGGDELIKPRLLRDKLISALTRIRSAGATINSIVVHRDGRWWPKETEALEEAVRFLQAPERQILGPGVRYCAVEIRKSHFPIRIMLLTFKNNRPVFQNPFPGCYLLLDDSRAVLTSTGKPSEWDEQRRTAGTILVQIAHNPGNLNIQDVTQDVFNLTQLNWSSPDIEINAPVTIRWADDLLRDLYIEPER